MTGISLHVQWPLTSQSQREQLVFHYGSNSTPEEGNFESKLMAACQKVESRVFPKVWKPLQRPEQKVARENRDSAFFFLVLCFFVVVRNVGIQNLEFKM
jgi:hypothetical protein